MKIRLFSFIIVSLLICTTGCYKDALREGNTTAYNDSKSDNYMINAEMRSITKDQAKFFAQSVYDAIIRSERPGLKESIKIPLKVSTTPQITSVYPITNQGTTTMFVVNFGYNEGYAVLSADKYTK